jgi:ubiquinone/menaquinone biosynthesis C-methylase UbiE
MKSNVIFKAADICTLPFENDSFDRVIVENVFEFIEDKNRGLSEIIRVTKPGGYIGVNSSFRHKKQTSEEKMMLDEMSKEIYKVGNFPFVLKEWEKLIKNYDLEDIQFLKPKITILSKLLDARGNFLKFKNTLIISYFSLLNKKFRKKIFILKNNFKAIKKDPSLGFQFFIFKKPLK